MSHDSTHADHTPGADAGHVESAPPRPGPDEAGDLMCIARFARVAGLILAAAGMIGTVWLGANQRFGSPFWWVLFLVVLGGCVMKASDDARRAQDARRALAD